MGVLSTVLGLVGFGWGISIGLVVGYFLFIYSQPSDVKVRAPCVRLGLGLSLTMTLRKGHMM